MSGLRPSVCGLEAESSAWAAALGAFLRGSFMVGFFGLRGDVYKSDSVISESFIIAICVPSLSVLFP